MWMVGLTIMFSFYAEKFESTPLNIYVLDKLVLQCIAVCFVNSLSLSLIYFFASFSISFHACVYWQLLFSSLFKGIESDQLFPSLLQVVVEELLRE
ncbi:hypothetical protein RchiOBHm_Chr1g0326191 [Rosa chinensis]|uniref:Uncharacterized protein n=1 Tax=Rosa chinensis TaxID=74649 RepID=A0A2P6SA76_ROSCH|nr:hypothetical protein RchiOBHm_Chr1g0326191 [Rosa chinensis]